MFPEDVADDDTEGGETDEELAGDMIDDFDENFCDVHPYTGECRPDTNASDEMVYDPNSDQWYDVETGECWCTCDCLEGTITYANGDEAPQGAGNPVPEDAQTGFLQSRVNQLSA